MEGFPTGQFDVVMADPPWRFASNSKAKPGRNAQRHYECMTTPEIVALPVPQITAKAAMLFLWATSPMLPEAMETMKAWGFRYVSQLCWDKQGIGTGYWVRGAHELLLIGKKGRFPAPRPAMFPTSMIREKRREHSRKPDWVHHIIEQRLPDARKVELFAREDRPGFTCWGNEIGKFEGAA